MSSGSHITPKHSAQPLEALPANREDMRRSDGIQPRSPSQTARSDQRNHPPSSGPPKDSKPLQRTLPSEISAEALPARRSWLSFIRNFRWLGSQRDGRPPAAPQKSRDDVSRWTRFPAVLSSVIVHTLLLLLLALWSVVGIARSGRTTDFEVRAPIDQAEQNQVEMQLADGLEPPPPQTPKQNPLQQPKLNTQPSSATLSELLTERAPEPTESQTKSSFQELLSATQIQLNAGFSSTGVEGRKPARRRELALARGGTVESEQAVEDALLWLAEHQNPNGSWTLVHSAGACNGRCRNDGTKGRFDTAATGLSLLAFLGAGYTHLDGKHRDTVRRGVYFLLQVMERTPQGGSFLYQSDRGMYNHGIAAFALCEAYQLTLDRDLKEAAQQAVDFIASAQNYRGGWGYLPKQPGDLTLSGWQIMALKSAHAAGLNIPSPTILKIDDFLDTQMSPGGTFFGYRKPGKSPTCTSIGLLVRLFRGMTHSDPRILDGAVYFRQSGPSNSDAYFNYYVTLFLFHVGGGIWEDWNPAIRDYLVLSQAKYGHEKGSWYFDNPYGKEGGRLYTTAMCAMTLEVYYRFSPLYQQSDQPFEL